MANHLMVAVIRLPEREEPFMREAIRDAASSMNAIGEPVVVVLPGDEDLPEVQVGAIMALGAWLPGVHDG